MRTATVTRRIDAAIVPHHAGWSFWVVICQQDGWETGRMEFQYYDDASTFAEEWQAA